MVDTMQISLIPASATTTAVLMPLATLATVTVGRSILDGVLSRGRDDVLGRQSVALGHQTNLTGLQAVDAPRKKTKIDIRSCPIAATGVGGHLTGNHATTGRGLGTTTGSVRATVHARGNITIPTVGAATVRTRVKTAEIGKIKSRQQQTVSGLVRQKGTTRLNRILKRNWNVLENQNHRNSRMAVVTEQLRSQFTHFRFFLFCVAKSHCSSI